MSQSISVLRGLRELRRLLQDRTFDLRALDLGGFRQWLDAHLAHWQSDPVFVQRTRIRDLRRAHPELAAREKQYRRARAEDERSPQFARLGRVEQELVDAQKAVAGLTAALEGAPPEREHGLRQKLEGFQAKQEALQSEQAALIRVSPQRQQRLRADAELQRARETIGLDREEARLQELLREQGRRSTRRGESFERLALKVTEAHLLTELLGRNRPAPRDLRVLSGVTLGAARTELDQLVVRRPRGSDESVDVLAMVEVKRNINDVARGFRQRQENLAWLTGDRSRYDPQQFRTETFPFGHFDRQVWHEQDGEGFVLGPGSFRRFRRDPGSGFFLRRLYLVTREGTMWGASAAALARIRFRAATDTQWMPDSDTYLRTFFDWCRSLAEPVETPDVLTLYVSTPRRARQILLVARETLPEGLCR